MKKIFVLIGIFAMFVVNCFILSAAQTVNLNGTSWQLSRIRQNGVNLEIPRNTKITVSFSGNKISGFSGINRYNGTYRVRNNFTLSTDISTTLMGGSEELMNFEMAFLDILQSSPKISYDKETLTLSNNKGEIWTFKVLTLEKKLHNTDWRLINMAGKNMKLQMKNEEQITLSFTENEINGNAGINNYFGTYKISSDNISISGIGATEMAGPDNLMRIEGEYLALLENVKKIKLINQKTLVLTTDKGKTLTFEK